MTIQYIIDGTIIVLLIAAFFMGYKLDGRMKRFRGQMAEMQALASQFQQATLNAQEAVTNLSDQANTTSAELSTKLQNAENLAQELDFLNSRAGKMVKTLETSTLDTPIPNTTPQPPVPTASTEPAPQTPLQSKTAQRLQEILKARQS